MRQSDDETGGRTRRRLFGGGLAAIATGGVLTATAGRAAASTSGEPWVCGGNRGVLADGSNFLGPRNVVPLIFKTASAFNVPEERMRITPTGRVGIGTRSPGARVEVSLGTDSGVALRASANGTATTDVAVAGVTTAGTGVAGKATGAGDGVKGLAKSGVGVTGTASSGTGVVGASTAGAGVIGTGERGVSAYGQTLGVYAAGSEYAGYFVGDVYVSGTLAKAAGSFKIDHPLDPERQWLSHSFVESPDMLNVYNGNVTLGPDGTATVELPDYFAALNRDYRYQLTAVGGPAPDLHVSKPVEGTRFAIAGGEPGLVVSWQVTGIRQDDYARVHPIVVEEPKTGPDRGGRSFVPPGSSAHQAGLRPEPPGRPPS